MDLNLSGRTAVVCGSTQGIGKAAALELAQLGASVVLVARNQEKLEAVLQELPTPNNQKHSFILGDSGKPEELQSKLKAYLEENGPAHILVNNTGGPAGGQAIDALLEEYVSAFTNHLLCNHLLAQEVVAGMKEEKFGRIINVISTSVKQPLNNLGVSNTVRGAVANWSKTLANELGQFNITVNNVLPGATNTVRLQSIIENKASKTGKSVEEVTNMMASASPMKRVAEAHEIANAIAFLASPAASYINGINIPVDGGRTGCL